MTRFPYSHGLSTTTAKGLSPLKYVFELTHNAIGGVAALNLHAQESPPPQHIEAVRSCGNRIRPFPGCAPSFLNYRFMVLV